jgi:hypothetical protein
VIRELIRCRTSSCQPTTKTGPVPTIKVSHPEAIGELLPAASVAGHDFSLQGTSAAEKKSTVGVGFGLAKAGSTQIAGGWSRWRVCDENPRGGGVDASAAGAGLESMADRDGAG